jgi:hypothetical protein
MRTVLVLVISLTVLVFTACESEEKFDAESFFDEVATTTALEQRAEADRIRRSASAFDIQVCNIFERAMTRVPKVDLMPFGMSLERFYAMALPDLRQAERIASRNSLVVDTDLRLAMIYLLEGIKYDDDALTVNIPRAEKRCALLGRPVSY